MEIFVNGKPVAQSLVTFNDGMNYDQRQRFSDEEIFAYRMVVDRAAFLDKFRAEFGALCAEMKADDEADGDISDEFAAYGYEGLDAALGYPDALSEAFASFMMRDKVFPHYLAEGRDWRTPTGFVINAMDKMTIEADRVVFEGWGYGYQGAGTVEDHKILDAYLQGARGAKSETGFLNRIRRLFKRKL